MPVSDSLFFMAREACTMFEPAKAPWIRPGVVVHEAAMPVDDLLASFAREVRGRGFSVAGYVQDRQGAELIDLATGETMPMADTTETSAAASRMRKAMRDDADLVVISHFSAMEQAAKGLRAAVDEGVSQGMPVLTSISGGAIQSWLEFAGQDGTIMPPSLNAILLWGFPMRTCVRSPAASAGSWSRGRMAPVWPICPATPRNFCLACPPSPSRA